MSIAMSRLQHARLRRVARRAPLSIELLEERLALTLLGQPLFPTDNPWNQDISNAPVAGNSAAVITNIGANVRIHPDWGEANPANGGDPLYGIPVNIVHGNTAAKVNVVIDNYPDESDIVSVPMPTNPILEGDYQNGPNMNGGGGGANQRGDSHLIIWDVDNNVGYELYGTTRPNDPTLFPTDSGVVRTKTDLAWHAAQESVWEYKTNSFRTLGATSADAAGLPILTGLARPDEGLPTSEGGQGAITHALRVTLPSSVINPQYVYPASHVVDVSQGSNKVPFGARLRLNNNATVNALIASMAPESQIIARAMQKYGLIVADIGSAMYVTGASAAVNASNQNTLVWNSDDIFANNGLKALRASDFQVVDLTPRVTGLSATSGPAGTTVTITGQNFGGSAGHLSVFFGSTPATSVTYVSDTQLYAVAPNGTGTVHVTVRSGVVKTDTISSSPNANSKAPVFGYGTSTPNAADQFTYSASTLTGDVNHDGVVNSQDIAQVAAHWLTHDSGSDVNADGVVNAQDIALIAGHWLTHLGGGSSLTAAGMQTAQFPAQSSQTTDSDEAPTQRDQVLRDTDFSRSARIAEVLRNGDPSPPIALAISLLAVDDDDLASRNAPTAPAADYAVALTPRFRRRL